MAQNGPSGNLPAQNIIYARGWMLLYYRDVFFFRWVSGDYSGFEIIAEKILWKILWEDKAVVSVLNLGGTDILNQIAPCHGECPMYSRVLSSIPGLWLIMENSLPVMTTQMSPDMGKIAPHWAPERYQNVREISHILALGQRRRVQN